MLRVCVVLRILPSQSSVRSLLVLLLYKQRCLSCLARPVWGTIGSCRAEAFCLGQMLGALWANKTQTKFTATFDQNLPSMKYIFAFFSKIYRKYCLRDHFLTSKFLKTYFRKHASKNNADRGQRGRSSPLPPLRTVRAFIFDRQDFSIFFPRRLASNRAYAHCYCT